MNLVSRSSCLLLLLPWLLASTMQADSLDDALASIKCTRTDLTIPTDIRWRDPFRLEIIDHLLAHPLEVPDYCQTMAEELVNADTLEAMIAAAGKRLEYGGGKIEPIQVSTTNIPRSAFNAGKLKQFPEIVEALNILYAGAQAAETERKKAFAPLSKSEYAHLLKNRYKLVTLIRGEENASLFDDALLAAARNVDYVALTRAGMIAARSVEAAEKILRGWKPPEKLVEHKKIERHDAGVRLPPEKHSSVLYSRLLDTETPLGRVVVGGLGNDTYDGKPIAILVELGGDDTYHCRVGAGVEGIGLAIDLSGDDTYEMTSGPSSKIDPVTQLTSQDFAFGSGDMGVGILLDCDGQDHYVGRDASLGSALFGVGVLLDRAGMDSYNVDEHGEAAANFGIAMLIDESGDDTYFARHFAQAVSGPLGFGLLLDRAGNDTYFAGGKHHGWSTSQTSYRSACQGFAQGIREYASGAIALLVDVAGNDSYRGGAICQGEGYWFALGALIDGAGNDQYNCLHYGQGGPFHFGIGALLDNAGNDYTHGDVATQGMGYDWSVGFHVDYAGNDIYEGGYLACGSGGVNGIGIFCDNAGDDIYRVTGGFVMGGGQWVDKRAAGSVGLFFDFDGNDRYPSDKYGNEKSWTQEFYGAGMDLKGGKPLFTKVMQVKPRPPLVPIAKLDDTWLPEVPNTLDGARQLFEIMIDGGGETPKAKKAEEKFLAMKGPALAVLIENVVQPPFYRCYGMGYSLLPKFGASAVPPLLELWKNKDPWMRCRAADVLGMLKPEEAQSALPALHEGLKDEQFWVRTSCVQALGRLGDKTVTPKLEELVVSDPHLAVRVRAAEALGKLKAADAVPTLTKALNDAYYQVRYGAQKALDAIAGKTEAK